MESLIHFLMNPRIGMMSRICFFLFRLSLVFSLLSKSSSFLAKKPHSRHSFKLEISSHKEWNIRPATPQDAEALEVLLGESYGELLKESYSKEILDASLPIIGKPVQELLTSGTWYVAQNPETNELVGCGGYRPFAYGNEDKEFDGVLHLRHFATSPRFLRMGVGKAIWRQICRDVDSIYCKNSHDDNDHKQEIRMTVFATLNAQPFYESFGFEADKIVEASFPNGSKFPGMIMNLQGRPTYKE
mmetsp:Transcript_28080/g.43219  ORF Transcript_28080/g.43219 Transcript_28080/m.43219 type:complete len:244 (+) Transcript_28080:123-854(+)